VSARRRRTRSGASGGAIAYTTAGTLLSAVFLAPLVWAVLRSFQTEGEITAAPGSAYFTHMTLANYRTLVSGAIDILRYVGNSLVVATGTAVLTAVLATLAGYGFGRFRFRGKGIVFALILVALMVPFQAVLTPLFLELNTMHLTDSWLGLILFYTTFNLPFGVFVMRNTFAQIPKEIEDAAHIDGASTVGTLLFVMRPMVVPGIATTFLYAFLFSWTEFLGALTFITNSNLLTLPVALFNVETGTFGQVNYGYLIAGAVIAMIPCVILFVALQRYYVRGLISGAVKG
jgi:multiple sugar transport system permease protein